MSDGVEVLEVRRECLDAGILRVKEIVLVVDGRYEIGFVRNFVRKNGPRIKTGHILDLSGSRSFTGRVPDYIFSKALKRARAIFNEKRVKRLRQAPV